MEEVLDVHLALQCAYRRISDKNDLKDQDVLFTGFDVQHERAEWRLAIHLRETEEQWKRLLKGEAESPTPTMDRYTRMLEKWNAIGKRHGGDRKWSLTMEDIKDILS